MADQIIDTFNNTLLTGPCPMCGFVDGTPVSLFAASLLLGVTPGAVRHLADRLHLEPHYMRRSPNPRLHRVFFVHELRQLRAALAPPRPRRRPLRGNSQRQTCCAGRVGVRAGRWSVSSSSMIRLLRIGTIHLDRFATHARSASGSRCSTSPTSRARLRHPVAEYFMKSKLRSRA
jgi:hypothetical protein